METGPLHLTAGDWIALSGAMGTLIAVAIAFWQLRDSHNTALRQMNASSKQASKQMEVSNVYAKGQNWLLLRNILVHYDDIHANFRPRGEWHRSTSNPDTVADWARVELYMGLFEFVDELIDKNMLDEEHVRAWYRYRIENIIANPKVVEYKLKRLATGWRRFLKLCKRLDLELPEDTRELSPFIRNE